MSVPLHGVRPQDTDLCKVAVGCLHDVSDALGENFAQYSDVFVTLLLEALQSKTLDRMVKTEIIVTLGDLAAALKGQFERYYFIVITVCLVVRAPFPPSFVPRSSERPVMSIPPATMILWSIATGYGKSFALHTR